MVAKKVASSPRKRSGLSQKTTLPLEVAQALKVEREISFNQIPGALQNTIDQRERVQGSQKIPVKALSDEIRSLLKVEAPVSDTELIKKLWEKIKASKSDAAPHTKKV